VDDEEVLKKIRGLSLSSWELHWPRRETDFATTVRWPGLLAAFGQDGIGRLELRPRLLPSDLDGIVMAAVKGGKTHVEQSKQPRLLEGENADLQGAAERTGAQASGVRHRAIGSLTVRGRQGGFLPVPPAPTWQKYHLTSKGRLSFEDRMIRSFSFGTKRN